MKILFKVKTETGSIIHNPAAVSAAHTDRRREFSLLARRTDAKRFRVPVISGRETPEWPADINCTEHRYASSAARQLTGGFSGPQSSAERPDHPAASVPVAAFFTTSGWYETKILR